MSSGSEPDGDFGADVESYDSQLEEEIENENAEREGNHQKRQLSDDEGESEENYEPERKKHKSGKSSKKKDKKQKLEKGKLIADIRNFEDLDVDVSSDEEFSEDEPEYDEEELQREIEGFIASDEDEEVRKAGKSQYRHANFVLPQDRDQKTAEAIAREIEDRHAKTYTQADDIEVDDDGGRSSIAQQSRLPTIKDPRLWMVKTQAGMEKIVAARILQKYLTHQNTPHPLSIFSVIAQDHLKGYIYIEARRENHVREAIDKMDGIMQFKVTMVQLDEMVQIMKVPKTKVDIKKGDWVRVKKGTYADDFAVIQEFDSVNNLAEVKIIPRIDFMNTHAVEEDEGTNKRGKKKNVARPQARLFNPDDVINLSGDASLVETFQDYNGENVHKWGGMNFKDGFLYKFFSVKNLNLDVKPTLEDIKNFSRVQRASNDDEEEDLQAKEKAELAFAKKAQQLIKKGPKLQLAKGDLVRVFEGDLKSLIGEVQTVEGDLVRIIPRHEALAGQILPIPLSQLQKYFRIGDHIKVRSGKHVGETGMIVNITEDAVTAMSDVGNKELKLLISDIQKCTDISTGQKLGEYALYDLVQLGPHDVGVIVRIDPDGAHILEENGKVRQIKLQGIRGKKDTKKSLGRDADGNTIGKGDAVQIVEGTHLNKKGLVKHIYRFFVFVHNREIPENNGIFVVKGKQCKLRGHSQNSMQAPTTAGRSVTNFGTKPVYNGTNRTSSRRNDSLLSKTVTVTRGPWKGMAGIVRSATDSKVMIQLQSSLEKISVSRDMIREEHVETTRSVDTYNDYSHIPYGAQTPSGGATPFRPQTPAHYGGATPQRPSTPHHDQDDDEHEADVHDQYSSNMNDFNFMAQPNTPMATNTPGLYSDGPKTPGLYSDGPKTPYTDNFQTPDTYNAPMTYDHVTTPMTFDPSTPGFGTVNTPGGYMHDSHNSGYGTVNTPGGYMHESNAPNTSFQRLDKIIVVDGEFKGKRGFIANLIDNSEGIVKFVDNEIKILKLNSLAKID